MDELGEITKDIHNINRSLTLLSINADDDQSSLINEAYSNLADFEKGILHKLRKAFENGRA